MREQRVRASDYIGTSHIMTVTKGITIPLLKIGKNEMKQNEKFNF